MVHLDARPSALAAQPRASLRGEDGHAEGGANGGDTAADATSWDRRPSEIVATSRGLARRGARTEPQDEGGAPVEHHHRLGRIHLRRVEAE